MCSTSSATIPQTAYVGPVAARGSNRTSYLEKTWDCAELKRYTRNSLSFLLGTLRYLF